MRITPHDIRQQQFTVRMFRGFDPQEVDAFLEDVADDYESLLKENQLLKEQIRSIDLPVRLGGEEFIILLPDTDKDGAVMVAEKIRRSADRLSIPRLGSMPGRKLTLSAGVATYPADAPDGL